MTLVVLWRGGGHSAPFRGPGASFMFSYMRLLSVTDLTYLLYCVETCAFVDTGYYLSVGGRDSPSRALIVYVWNCLTPLWNISAAASDVIIVCMTTSRRVFQSQITTRTDSS